MTILDRINEDILKENNKERKTSGKWKPSNFGRCLRLQYWARQGEKPSDPLTVDLLRRFKVGKLFHDFVQGYLPPTEKEVKCEIDNVLGFADVVTEDCVWDIKTQHSMKFWHLKKSDKDISEELYTNWLQVAFYAMTLKKPKCGLILISKDDLFTFEVQQNTSDWETIVWNEIKTLEGFWEGKLLPPATPRAYKDKKGTSKECAYCSFATKCKEMEKNNA